MAAEVLKRIDDQDFRACPGLLPAQMSCGKAGDPGTDHNQIIGFAGWHRFARRFPRGAVAHRVHHHPGGISLAAQAGQGGGAIGGLGKGGFRGETS